jgi:hypothetical protein
LRAAELTKNQKETPAAPAQSSFWGTIGWGALVLAVLLAIVFRKSFEPGQILFSNDGPLGAISSQSEDDIGGFNGFWQPLNWIGFQAPSALPSVTQAVVLATEPVFFSKIYTPFSLFFIGLAAVALFSRLGFSRFVCVLGGIATAFSTDYFSYACWGLGSLPLCVAFSFLALAALSTGRSWAWPALAGLAVGMGILEGFDSGAIMSLYVAAFTIFRYLVDETGELQKRLITGVAKLAVVVIFSVFMAAQALSTLIGTQISGIAGAAAAETAAAKEQNWNFATQWSLPKVEALRVLIPGLYGYRMDTPEGGNYWGTVGMPPGWETHHMGNPRFSGAGFYIGIVVLLFAAYAFVEAFRKDSALSARQKLFVRFWAAAAILSLLFSFGKYAPFYRIVYALPYFSTIRNPVKFMHPFSLSMVILFGYGLQAVLVRSAARATKSAGIGEKIRQWWQSAKPPERRWTWGCATFGAVLLLGLLVFTSSAREMTDYLQSVAVPASDAPKILKFSQQEIVWSLVFLLGAIGLFVLLVSGYFGGQRLKVGLGLLAALLVTDMVRANTPWVVYLDYRENYASNAIIEFLRQNPHEHRVATRFHPFGGSYFAGSDQMASVFGAVLNFWSQNLFPYYRIQSPDIIQMPREPELDKSFAQAFSPHDLASFNLLGRLWQLSNTRYVLGDKTFRLPANPPAEVPTIDFLNRFVSPDGSPFTVVTNFDIVPKGATATGPEDFTAIGNPNGRFSLYEFTGALPRTLLFSNWQVNANDQSTLMTLTQTNFNPRTSALAMSLGPFPPNGTNNPGTATITTYQPRLVEISADVKTPAFLVLFDRYDPLWTVTVDGKKEDLIRADYIFRGVYLQPGKHTVQFTFRTPLRALYVSLAAIVAGIGLCFYVAFRPEKLVS